MPGENNNSIGQIINKAILSSTNIIDANPGYSKKEKAIINIKANILKI